MAAYGLKSSAGRALPVPAEQSTKPTIFLSEDGLNQRQREYISTHFENEAEIRFEYKSPDAVIFTGEPDNDLKASLVVCYRPWSPESVEERRDDLFTISTRLPPGALVGRARYCIKAALQFMEAEDREVIRDKYRPSGDRLKGHLNMTDIWVMSPFELEVISSLDVVDDR